MNVKLLVAYDGSAFLGWQKTKEGRSVEEELQRALEQILQHPILLQAASRTDRGVHAAGQVVNFFTHKSLNTNQLQNSLNDLLPKEIRIIQVEEAPPSFHPTLDCLYKEYHYFLCNQPLQLPWQRATSWHCSSPLDLSEMRKAALTLLGEHDFSSLSNRKKNEKYQHKRRLLLEICIEEGELLLFKMKGNHFLYKMARTLVGTLVDVGRGKIAATALPELLAARDRKKMGVCAPAHGLFLHRVVYAAA